MGNYEVLVDQDRDSWTLEEAARALVMEALDSTEKGWVRVPRESLLVLARSLTEERVWDNAKEEFTTS